MMTYLQRREISRTTTRGPRTVGSKGQIPDLTRLFKSVTINPIEGDKLLLSAVKQPHLEPALWAIYLEQAMRNEMRPVDPPADGTEEAPGAHPQKSANVHK